MTSATPQLLFLRRTLRLGWFIAGAALLVWIFWMNFPPDGVLSASARTAEPNGFIGGFTPLDRAKPVREGDRWYSDIVNEPVYFHVAAPRFYDQVRLRLTYRLEGQPYAALGARTDLEQWQFDLRAIDLPILDASGWPARQDGELRVYERKATARSAKEILNAGGRLAVLGLDPVRWGLKLAPLYQEKQVDAVLDEAGSRTIYTYVQKGQLELSLGLRGSEGAGAVVTLERDGKVLLTRRHEGDGAVQLVLTGAVPGLYRVRLEAPDSVKIVGLTSRQSRVVLMDAQGEHVHAPSGAVKFDPEFPVLTWQTDLKSAPYDAVVAAYRPPTIGPSAPLGAGADGWRTAEATFDLRRLPSSQGRLQMLVSLPAVKSAGGKMRVDHVEVEYVRPPIDFKTMWKKLKSLL